MKIDFNKNTTELFEIGNESNNVTIDDTVNTDAVEVLVEMYNEGYSSHRIKSNLEQDERLTGDEVDHLMGAIDVLEEMERDAPWTPDINDLPFANVEASEHKTFKDKEDYVEGIDLLKTGTTAESILSVSITNSKAMSELEPENADKVKEIIKQDVEVKKERKKREVKTPGITVPTGNNKAINPQDFIKLLQEKIELTKLVSEIQAPEIPEGLTKAGRELMIKFSQDHNKLIADYLGSIQIM